MRHLSPTLRPCRALVHSALVTALLPGCSITTERQEGQSVSRAISLGVVRPISCDGVGRELDTEVFGLGIARDELVLGYARDQVVCLPTNSCTAVFFIETDAHLKALRRLFPALPSACFVSRKSTT